MDIMNHAVNNSDRGIHRSETGALSIKRVYVATYTVRNQSESIEFINNAIFLKMNQWTFVT